MIIGVSVGVPVAFVVVVTVIIVGTIITLIIRHRSRQKFQTDLAIAQAATAVQ